MSTPTLAPYIIKRPWLLKMLKPIAQWYGNSAGYRKLGLRADDLIPEENETVQRALKRLSPQEAYDRVYRMRRAFQCSLTHTLLPKTEWTKPEEDYPYLSPIIKALEAEKTERQDLETITVRASSNNSSAH